MKLTIEKNGEIVKAIKAEYTPAEWLVINYAMRRFTEVSETDKAIMKQMLSVEPEEESEGTE